MQTNACTSGALRILAACARGAGEPLTMPEMASRLGMTEALVVKACHKLMRAGYLVGARGRGGGYRLGRPAEAVTVLEVVSLFEDKSELFPCGLSPDGACRVARVCRLREICAVAWGAWEGRLAAATIASIVAGDAAVTPASAPTPAEA